VSYVRSSHAHALPRDLAAARHQYELFLTAMQDADPALATQIAEARQALTRLGFAPRG